MSGVSAAGSGVLSCAEAEAGLLLAPRPDAAGVVLRARLLPTVSVALVAEVQQVSSAAAAPPPRLREPEVVPVADAPPADAAAPPADAVRGRDRRLADCCSSSSTAASRPPAS